MREPIDKAASWAFMTASNFVLWTECSFSKEVLELLSISSIRKVNQQKSIVKPDRTLKRRCQEGL